MTKHDILSYFNGWTSIAKYQEVRIEKEEHNIVKNGADIEMRSTN